MGKKKSFIDKRNSKTYTLVFRSTDDNEDNPEEEGDRVLVPADGQGAAAAAAAIDREEPPIKDPRALYALFFGGGDDGEKVWPHHA
jgi:hypothetical protein